MELWFKMIPVVHTRVLQYKKSTTWVHQPKCIVCCYKWFLSSTRTRMLPADFDAHAIEALQCQKVKR